MNHDRIISASVPIEDCNRSVRLAAQRFGSRFQMNWRGEGDGRFYGMSMEDLGNEYARRAVLEITARVASKKLDVKTVRFPSTWRDAALEAFASWANRWGEHGWATAARKRINYTEVTLEANAYWPSLEIPNHEAFVDIAICARNRKWERGDS
jgi:hypothetical protein